MAKGLMVSFWLSLLGLVSSFICGCVSARAQQFSADLVTTHISAPEIATAGKLRVFNDKVRIETPDFADGFFLVNATSRAAFFARPAKRIFMDARQSSRLTRMFIPVDPNDPCRQWQTMAKLAGTTDPSDSWLCERIGEEMIDGRRAAIYRAVSAPNRNILGWIDADLKFPLRIQTEDGVTITAENIKEEPQPARLFEIPPDFRKFDPQALIKRIKQSDVWVDEPPL